jgi:hypothetical protein
MLVTRTSPTHLQCMNRPQPPPSVPQNLIFFNNVKNRICGNSSTRIVSADAIHGSREDGPSLQMSTSPITRTEMTRLEEVNSQNVHVLPSLSRFFTFVARHFNFSHPQWLEIDDH